MFVSRWRISHFGATILLPLTFLAGVCLGEHPFLIVNESDYTELQARASQEPWAGIKTRAIDNSNLGYGNVGTTDYRPVRNCLSSSTLSYILDVPNQATYKNRIYDGIMNQLDKLEIGDSYSWHGAVVGGNVLFFAINALDVIHDDLTSTERTDCQSKIQGKVDTISVTGSWAHAREGLHGTWDLYNGTSYNPDQYYNEIMTDLTPDGVCKAGSTYANARFSYDDRTVKSLFMDILEHTGTDTRYYNNPRIQEFQEWLYTGTISPSRRFIPFGDSYPGNLVYDGCSPRYRAKKFG